jgi:hypothetical protein
MLDLKLTILFSTLGVILISFCLLFFKMRVGIGPNNLKVYGITFIVSIGTIVAMSDIPQSNMTPIFGILGATIGYLFGLKNKNEDEGS